MSTLPPTPEVDPNIPIVTPNGGSAAAYNDPHSPESIMKKTHGLNVQSKTDGKFDVAASPYESFRMEGSYLPYILLGLLCILLLASTQKKNVSVNYFIAACFLIYLIVCIHQR
jgi:hypothetical protein